MVIDVLLVDIVMCLIMNVSFVLVVLYFRYVIGILSMCFKDFFDKYSFWEKLFLFFENNFILILFEKKIN